MKILAFLHGTTIMHASAVGKPREERVRQVQQHEPSVHDFAAYVPVDNAAGKLQTWSRQGAEISYLSSHRAPEDVQADASVIQKYAFPSGQVFFRQPGEEYAQVVERVRPDVLIEDDCESIGGVSKMILPTLAPEMREHMTVIVVREFEGIDHLLDDVSALTDK